MNFSKNLQELKIFLQRSQKASFILLLATVMFLFWVFGSTYKEKQDNTDRKIAKPEIKSVQDAVDPRCLVPLRSG